MTDLIFQALLSVVLILPALMFCAADMHVATLRKYKSGPL